MPRVREFMLERVAFAHDSGMGLSGAMPGRGDVETVDATQHRGAPIWQVNHLGRLGRYGIFYRRSSLPHHDQQRIDLERTSRMGNEVPDTPDQ